MFRVYSRARRLRGRLDHVAVVFRDTGLVCSSGRYGKGETYAEVIPYESDLEVEMLCAFAEKIAHNVHYSAGVLLISRRFWRAVEGLLSEFYPDADADADGECSSG